MGAIIFNLSWWWQHHYILPLTVSKRDHISINELYISARRNQLAIKFRAVRTLQVDQIRLYLIFLVSKLIRDGLEAELYDGVLLRNARVLQSQVCNVLISAGKPTATLIQLHSVEQILLLEDIHPPLLFSRRLACFCRLMIFEDSACASDGVGFFGK